MSPNNPDSDPALSRQEPTLSAAPREALAVPASATANGDSALVAQVARAYLEDRKRERRWRVFFRFAWLLIALGFLAVAYLRYLALVAPTGPHTALVDVRGEISVESLASAENVIQGLRNAFEETNAKAVVLRINSPGGSPVQAGIINDEARRLKALHNKKLYAVCEEMCASAAFYVAVAADEVFVDKASLVGSIGVLMDSFGFTGVMEKLGVERRLLTAGENKGFLDPFSPQSERHKAYAQAMLDQIHKQFIGVVKAGRGAKLKQTPEMFSGLFWDGQQAIDLGLADRFGSLDSVARDVVKAEEVIDYTPQENVAERLAKRFGASIGEGAVKALRALPAMR
jgi:protease-4